MAKSKTAGKVIYLMYLEPLRRKKKSRSSPWRVLILLLLIGAAIYVYLQVNQQQIEPLPSGQLALSVLPINALLTATQPGLPFKLSQLFDVRIVGHVISSLEKLIYRKIWWAMTMRCTSLVPS